MTKILLLFSFFSVQITQASSQPYVLAKDKANVGSITAFNTVDNKCESGIKNVGLYKDSIFFIVDEVFCRNEKFFILILEDKIYFARDIQFSNIELIRKNINQLRIDFPIFDDRVFLAKKQILNFKDSIGVLIEKNKKIRDSIDLAIKKSTLARLRQMVDTLGPKRTLIYEWDFFNHSERNENIYNVTITVFNPYRKKIKYLEFTFYGYNPVDDPALDLRYKTNIRKVKGIGPIEPLETAKYNFQDFFYSNSLSTLKLKSVKVIFFDGSVTEVLNPVQIAN